MKLGEIKIESLKLMFANNDDQLTVDNRDNGAGGNSALDLLEASIDPQYRDYLNNMNGSINRCFSILESRKILPMKRTTLVYSVQESQENYEIDLSSVTDLDDIEKVIVRKSYNNKDYDVDYTVEGDTLIVPYVEAKDSVRLIYYPRLSRLSMNADNTQELPIPDKIAVLIPYYVKYDLFREDSESEANAALRQFESALSEIVPMKSNYQTAVDNVFGMTYWRD